MRTYSKKIAERNELLHYLSVNKQLSLNEKNMIKEIIRRGHITSIEELKAYVYLEKNPEYLNV